MESFEIEQHVLFSVAICSFTLYQCFQCPRMGLDVNINLYKNTKSIRGVYMPLRALFVGKVMKCILIISLYHM